MERGDEERGVMQGPCIPQPNNCTCATFQRWRKFNLGWGTQRPCMNLSLSSILIPPHTCSYTPPRGFWREHGFSGIGSVSCCRPGVQPGDVAHESLTL